MGKESANRHLTGKKDKLGRPIYNWNDRNVLTKDIDINISQLINDFNTQQSLYDTSSYDFLIERNRSIEAIPEFISSKCDKSDLSVFHGRRGSADFEECLKKMLSDNMEELLDYSEDRDRLFISDIKFDMNDNESRTRTFCDMTITLSDRNDEYDIPVNIKATNGGTADNICGWEGMGYSLFKERVNTEREFMSLLKTGNIRDPDDPSDYGILVFQKRDSIYNTISSGSMHSLLTASEDSFLVNISQPFPLQFNSAKDIGKEGKIMTVTDARRSLIDLVVPRVIKKRKEKLYTIEDAYSSWREHME